MFDVFVASSLNSRIYNSIDTGSFDRLSDKKLLKLRNKLRNQYQTIIVGANTIKKDNPTLLNKDKSNIRIVIDKYADLPLDSKIFNIMPEKTYLLLLKNNSNYEKALKKLGVNVVKIDLCKNSDVLIMKKVLEIKKGNVLVEGGAKTLAYMFHNEMINNIKIVMFPIFFSDNSLPLFDGLPLDINLKIVSIKNIESKYLYVCYKVIK